MDGKAVFLTTGHRSHDEKNAGDSWSGPEVDREDRREPLVVPRRWEHLILWVRVPLAVFLAVDAPSAPARQTPAARVAALDPALLVPGPAGGSSRRELSFGRMPQD